MMDELMLEQLSKAVDSKLISVEEMKKKTKSKKKNDQVENEKEGDFKKWLM